MKLRFQKTHGARNDFLLSWEDDVPAGLDRRAVARAICDRHSGVGADGWLVITPGDGEVAGSIALLNSDGSDSEISGNGTRCAAAVLVEAGLAGEEVRIRTGAGVKRLLLRRRNGCRFEFEMDMGRARVAADGPSVPLHAAGREWDTTILDVGNPQCAVFVGENGFPEDWRAVGKALEWHSRFPKRTNVSFVRIEDRHTLDVLFWERGAGETASSGTGSTGAAAAAIARGLVEAPLVVRTPAGPLLIRAESADLWLTGPAEIVACGEYHLAI